MTLMTTRTRLMAGAALMLGLTAALPQAAAAQCALTATDLTCSSNTTTTNTLNAGVPGPTTNRAYNVVSGATPFAGSVASGVMVDGYGLNIYNTSSSGSGISFVNDGLIQINAGNTASVNGNAALTLWSAHGDIVYSGTGDILNLGTAGSGTSLNQLGVGNITASFAGNVTGTTNYAAIYAQQLGSGNVTLDTAAGKTLSAGGTGIWAQFSNTTTAGDVAITNNANIVSLAIDPLERGAVINHDGYGSSTIVNNGTIGSASDRMRQQGISVYSSNSSNGGNIAVSGTGTIWSVGSGIGLVHSGLGNISVNYSGDIDSSNRAINAQINNTSSGGNIDIVSSGALTAGWHGINTATTGTGNVSVTNNGSISAPTDGYDGINANATSGTITINSTGTITAGEHGIYANTTSGNITITAGDTYGDWDGIWASSTSGTINITTTGAVAAGGASGIYSKSGGIRTITVDSGSTLTGSNGMYIDGAGALDVSNQGSITGSSNAIAYVGTGAVTISNNGTLGSAAGTQALYAASSSGVSILNNGSANISGNVTLGGGDDLFNNYGQWDTAGVSDFGAGQDTLINYTGSSINVANGSTFNNLEALHNTGTWTLNGVLNLGGVPTMVENGGTINGTGATITAANPLTFNNRAGGTATLAINGSTGNDFIDNAGTLNLTGAALGDGSDILHNSGIVNLNGIYDFGDGGDTLNNTATGTVTVTGPTTLGNLESLINAGTLTLNDGLTLDGLPTSGTITVTNSGTINGSGGAIIAAAPLTFNNLAGATASLTIIGSTGIDTISNAGTLNLQGALLGADDDTLANSGTLNLSGIYNFGAGTDALTNAAAGTVTLTGPATLSNLETLSNAGTLTLNNVLTLDGVPTTVTNSGVINGSGGAITANAPLTFNNLAGATASLTINGSAGDDAISNAGTLNLQGAALGDGADTLANSGALNLNGTYDFGAGTDALTNAAAGTVTLTGPTTVSNLETLSNAGTVNANNGLIFSGVATTVSNSGTFNLAAAKAVSGAGATSNSGTFNAGAGSSYSGGAFTNTSAGTINTAGNFTLTSSGAFVNSGTINLAPGNFTVTATEFRNGVPPVVLTGIHTAAVPANSGTINATGGATTITTSTPLINSGTINLADGAANDVLTLVGDYVGSNGHVVLDVADSATDRFVVTGAASGTTSLDLMLIGTGLTNTNGLLVIDAGSSTAGAFTLGSISGSTSPLMNYTLQQRSADYYLTSSLNANGLKPLTLTRVAGEMWYQSADEIFAQLDQPTAANASGLDLWGHVYAARDKQGDVDTVTVSGTGYAVNNELKNHRLGVQMGVGANLGGPARIGLTGGWERNKAQGDADFTAKGWNVGAYGKFGGAAGFHGYALVKHDSYTIDFDDSFFAGAKVDGRSNGVDGNIGYRWASSGTGSFDLNAGVSRAKAKIDALPFSGVVYDYQDMRSTRARAQARYDFGGDWNPYVALTGYHEFNNDGRVIVNDGINTLDFPAKGKGSWGRLEAGVGGNGANFSPIFALWGEMGDVKGIGARLGFRFGGRTEVAAPPPPPQPAPPPAPATQTCADGSVILASDACPSLPPPPPPPPPAPAPERG